MECHMEFQLLRLKVSSEIVRSSQAAVAFSRVFYLEEVLIDRIGKELRDLKEEYKSLLRNTAKFLDQVRVDDDEGRDSSGILSETLRIHTELDGMKDVFEEFEERILLAEARRQAKSSFLQQLSTNELISKFESLTSSELRDLQVPEFSCFINESDFGTLERLNEDWNLFREDLKRLIRRFSDQQRLVRINDVTTSNRDKKPNGRLNPSTTISRTKSEAGSLPSVADSSVPLDEIGKTFANRSGSVIRKFSTLLRRGKRSGAVLPSDSFGESSEA